MNSDNNYDDNLKKIEIPKDFKTFISEEYFANCISCDKYLLGEATEYVIEKAIKDGYVEFEYAMCMDCVEKMRKRMSEESLQRIQKYFEEHFDFMGKRYSQIQSGNSTVDDYISKCIFNNKSRSELDEYQIMGHCMGTKLILSVFPYMVSQDIIEEIQELLSAKTREELDDFTNKHFGLPPDLKEIIKTKKPILL